MVPETGAERWRAPPGSLPWRTRWRGRSSRSWSAPRTWSGRRWAAAEPRLLAGALLDDSACGPGLRRLAGSEGERHRDRRAGTGLAVDGDLSVLERHQLADAGQAESGAAVGHGERAALELVEDALEVVPVDTAATIGDEDAAEIRGGIGEEVDRDRRTRQGSTSPR